MKLFHFYRVEDHSGVSGTGPVVEGVQFGNGWCALRWISNKSSLCFYQSLEEVKSIHSHGGKTEVIVHDFEQVTRGDRKGDTDQMELLMLIIDETSRLVSVDHLSDTSLKKSVQKVKALLDDLEILMKSKTAA